MSARIHVFVLLVAMGSARNGRAQSPPPACTEAASALERGVARLEDEHPDEALALFQRALDLCPTPQAEAQVGLAHAMLQHWPEAKRHLSAALANTNDSWISLKREKLDRALAEIDAHLPAAEKTENIDTAAPPPAVESTPAPSPWSRRRVALVGIVVGPLLLAGGLAANLLYNQQVRHYNYECVGVNKTRDEICPGERGVVFAEMGLAIAGYALGGAVTITSLLVLVLPSRRSTLETTHARISCGSGPGVIGISCMGRF